MHISALRKLKILAAAILFAAGGAAPAAQRTFVSAAGSDANVCSFVAPCRSFAAAMLNTDPNGEVVVLDSAGYGPVTIGQSVSIVAPAGIYGGITVFSGNGITVDGSGIAVVLRGLTVSGQGGLSGVHFAQGSRLTVEDCTFANLSLHGIFATAPSSLLFVKRTVSRGNGNMGVLVQGSVVANLDGLHVEGNDQTGVVASDGAQVTLANSVLSKNKFVGLHAHALANVSVIRATHTVISGSADSVMLTSVGGTSAIVIADALVISDATHAAFNFAIFGGTGIAYTAGNNVVEPGIALVVGGTLTPFATH